MFRNVTLKCLTEVGKSTEGQRRCVFDDNQGIILLINFNFLHKTYVVGAHSNEHSQNRFL